MCSLKVPLRVLVEPWQVRPAVVKHPWELESVVHAAMRSSPPHYTCTPLSHRLCIYLQITTYPISATIVENVRQTCSV
jgi:hypothetical protein